MAHPAQRPSRQIKLQRSSIVPKKGVVDMDDDKLSELRRILEEQLEGAQAIEAGKDAQKAQIAYNHKIQRLIRDSDFRKKLTRQFSEDHSAFE